MKPGDLYRSILKPIFFNIVFLISAKRFKKDFFLVQYEFTIRTCRRPFIIDFILFGGGVGWGSRSETKWRYFFSNSSVEIFPPGSMWVIELRQNKPVLGLNIPRHSKEKIKLKAQKYKSHRRRHQKKMNLQFFYRSMGSRSMCGKSTIV